MYLEQLHQYQYTVLRQLKIKGNDRLHWQLTFDDNRNEEKSLLTLEKRI